MLSKYSSFVKAQKIYDAKKNISDICKSIYLKHDTFFCFDNLDRTFFTSLLKRLTLGCLQSMGVWVHY